MLDWLVTEMGVSPSFTLYSQVLHESRPSERRQRKGLVQVEAEGMYRCDKSA